MYVFGIRVLGNSIRHLGQFQVEVRSSAPRDAARREERSEDWRAHDWMQRRWKTAKQRDEQDQVGSVGRMRSRQMRHDSAPERDEVRNDRILVRSGDSRPEISM